MTFAASLIPGLDEFVKHGDPKRRAEAARRIAELFLLGAANFWPDHVDLFDGVLSPYSCWSSGRWTRATCDSCGP